MDQTEEEYVKYLNGEGLAAVRAGENSRYKKLKLTCRNARMMGVLFVRKFCQNLTWSFFFNFHKLFIKVGDIFKSAIICSFRNVVGLGI